jgi:branched-chain amino acid transport system substrate-binding protein
MVKMARRTVFMVVLALILSVTIVWSGGQQEGARADGHPEVVRVGVLLPLTGAMAIDGANMRNGYELGAFIINNEIDADMPLARTKGLPNLGGARLELVFADDQGVPERGMSEVERLITSGQVDAIAGAYSSAVTATAQRIAERHQFPMVNDLSSSPMLNKQGLQWFFRTTPDDTIFMRSFFDFLEDLKERDGASWESVAILHEDSLWGTDCGKLLADFAVEYGYDLKSVISFPSGTVDLSSEVSRLKTADPDILLQFSYAQDQVLLVNTMKLLDFDVDLLLSGIQYPAIFEALDADADGMIFREVFNEDAAQVSANAAKVVELWQEQYGGGMGNAPRATQGIIVLADAINRAGSTEREAIRTALRETDISADQLFLPWDGVKFDENGLNERSSGIMVQYMHGSGLHQIWPFETAVKDPQYPQTPWRDR